MNNSFSINQVQGTNETVYTIGGSEGSSMVVSSFGACLRRFTFSGKELVMAYGDPAHFHRNGSFLGVTVGRYANRIAHGTCTINGEEIKLSASNNGNHLHGGFHGLHAQNWTSKIVEGTREVSGVGQHFAGVLCSITSPSGQEGFPGTMEASVLIGLTWEGNLFFEYKAHVDEPCPCNFTNHSYWNLDNLGQGTIKNHSLQLDCPYWLPTINDIPQGEAAQSKGSIFDFTQARSLGPIIEQGGVDHCFIISPKAPTLTCKGLEGTKTLRRAGLAQSETVAMEVYTDKPGVQLYTGMALPRTKAQVGTMEPFSAFCLETQFLPDSPNQGERYRALGTSMGWTSEEMHNWDGILYPGTQYQSLTFHIFKKV